MRRALLFLDLDGFKQVNDRFGHGAGDTLLTAAAGRLRHALRPGDLLARLGGDEFVVFLDGPATEERASIVARRLNEALLAPFSIGGEEPPIAITVSIGIALAAPGEIDAIGLLHRADLAMYDAKNEGPGRSRFGPLGDEPQRPATTSPLS